MDMAYEPSDDFYGALLGVCESVECTRFTATGQQTERCHCADLPDGWNSYVVVEDVDQAAVQARRLGAKTVVAPTDVAGVGRIYVFQDPRGTTVALVSYFR